jgi:uncharacterized RDD family membrane protein YckC/uncharacterized membrane protein SpoIIM required for sporulation
MAVRPPVSASLDQHVDVETPEQVMLSYTVAGIGSRAVAALIDYAIIAAFFIAVDIVFSTFSITQAIKPWLTAVMIIGFFLVNWGYYVVFEAMWDGQTPGKRRMGLRVVRDGGYSITFAASAVRNLIRVIDILPPVSYGIGILSAVLSKSGKRLGDYAAGTFVVRERALVGIAGPGAADEGAAAAGLAAPGAAPPVALLNDDEYALLERFIQRRQSLEPGRRAQFTGELAGRFRARVPAYPGSDPAFLVALFESERTARSRGAASPSDTGAAREQHALVAEGMPRWREFAGRLARARRRGLAGLPEQEVSDFAARYRELTTDLARLTTAARGRESEALLYLNRLVASGHSLLYRERPVAARSVWRYITETIPAEVRRSAFPIGLAALLTFGPAAIAYVAVVQHADLASKLLPAGMLARANEDVERAKTGEGYIHDPDILRPVMATSIIANNVQVTYVAFAGGILAGIGTVVILVSNGISLGAALGLYQSKGILPLIVAFVAPHGVLELSAICIAGGGGLLLGSALLVPGALTRREALVVRGKRAITLIAAASLLLIPAGLIEGFVSPTGWWTLPEKLIVSALTAVLLALFLNFDRGRRTVVSPLST